LRPFGLGVLLVYQINQNVEYGHGPVAPVAKQAQIGQRFFGCARFCFNFGQLVAELDEDLAIAETLIRRQGQDTSDIVVLARLFLLGEIAHDVEALGVVFGENIEQERVRVVVKELVVEKEFR
jgi:hypothetical protein